MDSSSLRKPRSPFPVRFWKAANLWYERLLLIVLILVLLIALWCMYDNYYVFHHTSDRVAGYKPGTVSSEGTAQEKTISSDMVAWITLDDTNIDYPVMQGEDNVKYLNTDPFGDYSLAGSIFLDSRNSADFSDDYSLVYGHHMEYGRMFGALDDYLDERYMDSHTTGELLIGREGETTYRLEVFAALQASALDEAVFEPGKADIRAFVRDNAQVYRGSDERTERILGLSTCSDESASARVVVFCYIME
ncbi:MAG: class B sortase [Oscillospiraceae bacterium]|nr:class B sortase [Oscillospiraceae bacterium]